MPLLQVSRKEKPAVVSRRLHVIVLVLLLAATVPSQTTLLVPGTPVAPGSPFTVVLTNNTSICIDTLVTNVLTLLQPGGELIAPVLVGCGPVAYCLANGQSASLTYATPASGPGSSGSFVLLCPYGSGAAARLDVGTASPVFADIHTYPVALPHGPGAHHINVPPGPGPDWEFASTATQPRLISPSIGIYTPGGSTPVAFTSFPALTVPAGGVARVSLPLAGLAPGPYTVQVDWIDPGLGGPASIRHGIEISAGLGVDLHLPGGRSIPPSGSIPARLALPQPAYGPPPTWSYALAAGILPGSTPLPGGALVPLVAEPLVLASLANGINGLLTANVGTTVPSGIYCAHAVSYWPTAGGITIAHPGVAGVSGFVLRVAVVALDPISGAYAASQPEEITLQ